MNWDSICYVLQAFEIKKEKHKKFQSAENILLLDEFVLDESNTLYICLDHAAEQIFEKALVVSIGPCRVQAENYIELGAGTPASVFNALMQPDKYLKVLGELLNDASTNQEIIDIASSYLGAPFFYFDESYRILAITRDLMLENDPEWEYMTTQRFLSPQSVRIMQERGDLDMLAKETEPVIYDADFFPFVSIVTNIKYKEQPYARLNRLCMDGKITPLMKEECSIVSRSLYRLVGMRSSSVYRGPADNLIRDLLNGVQLPETLIRDRLKQRYQLKEEYSRICVVDVNTGDDIHVPSYYSVLIERVFSDEALIHLIYEDNIVLILQAEEERGFAQLLSELRQFFARQQLRAGISNVFRKLSNMKIHYEQAFAALGYASEKELVGFNAIEVDYMISLIPDERKELFVSEDLRKLEESQVIYQFPLAETLRIYLENSCSLQKTAETMYLHKNTLLYRINIIKELLQRDLSDPYERMKLLLSMRIAGKNQ